MTPAPRIPTAAQQIMALAAAAEAARRNAYDATRKSQTPEERVRSETLDRCVLELAAAARTFTCASVFAGYPETPLRRWSSRLADLRRKGWIEVKPAPHRRNAPLRYAITDAGRAMLATLSATAPTGA